VEALQGQGRTTIDAHLIRFLAAHPPDPRIVAASAASLAFAATLAAQALAGAGKRRDLRTYRAVFRAAARGGSVTPREREVLAAIARALDLPPEAAARVEQEARTDDVK
jgi:hypothetical protein